MKDLRRVACPFRSLELLERRLAMSGVPPLVVSELMYHPVVTESEIDAGFVESDFEYVELANAGHDAIPLTDVEISGGIAFRFDAIALGPQQYVVVVRNRDAFEFRYGSERLIAGEFDGTLSNRSDRIRVRTADGTEVVDFEYEDQWYPETDGGGYALTLVDPSTVANDLGDAAAWRRSYAEGGSPGVADTIPPSGVGPVPTSVEGAMRSVRHAEVRWTPPTSASGDFAVFRNGELLVVTAGQSYLDDSVAIGQTYQYQVSIMEPEMKVGPLSQPVEISIEPPGGEPSFADPVMVGTVTDPELVELSGLAASRANASLYWTSNDGIGNDRVFAIRADGSLRITVTLDGVESIDWEDLAVGPGPISGASYVYVGDIGDNNGERDVITVYRFREPQITTATGSSLRVARAQLEAFTFTYPNGPLDAEVLMVDPVTGDLLVVAKETGDSRIYRATAESLVEGRVIPLVEIGTTGLNVPSGGDISPDGSEILLRNEDEGVIYVRSLGASLVQAFQGEPYSAPMVGTPEEPNGEAVAYATSGDAYFTVSEGVNSAIYGFVRTGPARAGDSNLDGIFDSSDLVQVFQFGRYETNQPALWSEGDWNTDGYFDTSDLVLAFQSGGYVLGARQSEYGSATAIASRNQPDPLVASAVDDVFAREQNDSSDLPGPSSLPPVDPVPSPRGGEGGRRPDEGRRVASRMNPHPRLCRDLSRSRER